MAVPPNEVDEVLASREGAATVRAPSDFDTIWLRIALIHERDAREARGLADVSGPGSAAAARSYEEEMRAALVAVTAASYSIEALFNHALQRLAPGTAPDLRPPRSRAVLDVLGAAFDIGESTRRTWDRDVPALFTLRGAAVHHEALAFPAGGADAESPPRIAPQNAVYHSRRAAGAAELAIDVLGRCYTSPRPEQPRIVAWVEGRAATLSALLAEGRESGRSRSGRTPAGL